MPIPSTMADLSITAASNFPAGSESPTTGDDYLRAHAAILRTTNAKGADIASATTTDIGAATGEFVDVTGTTTITGLGTIAAGIKRTVRFTGALTLTHNATSLILPGSANIPTANGDVAQFISLGSGNWKCTGYIKQNGRPISTTGLAASGANSDITSLTVLTAITTTGGVDIKGTNTNDSAAAGDVGEYISSNVAAGSAVALTTATAKTITSISLTAGDWDVSGFVAINPAATTNLTLELGCSHTVIDSNAGVGFVQRTPAGYVPAAANLRTIPTIRYSLNATTTIYLNAQANFTVSSCSSYGLIAARRVR
jgi:hypothetical protein